MGRVRIAIIEAVRLSKANRERFDQVSRRHTALTARVDRERDALDLGRREAYGAALVPFRDTFARVKNVHLADLTEIGSPGAAELPSIDVPGVRLSAVTGIGAVAGGVTAGAGAGSAAFAGVGAFAAASTGTPIAALSGAAATNATLAWLGGGTLAAGGGGVAMGTVVLGGLIGAPILLAGTGFLAWEGRRQLRSQTQTSACLAEAEAGLVQDERRWAEVIERSEQMRAVLIDLQSAIVARLPRFSALVEDNDDYATYPPDRRVEVATLVGLVTVAIAIMATPPADGSGTVTDASAQVVNDARQRLIIDLDDDTADEETAA